MYSEGGCDASVAGVEWGRNREGKQCPHLGIIQDAEEQCEDQGDAKR